MFYKEVRNMGKTLRIIAWVSVLGLVFLGSSALGQQRDWNCFEASWLIGYPVYTPSGKMTPLGQISNLVIDQSNGRIALIILSDVPGFGAQHVAIPFGSLPRDFRISFPPNIHPAPYIQQPHFNPYQKFMAVGLVPSVIDSTWVAGVYKQYERIAYWTEKGQESPMGFYRSDRLMGAKVQSPQGAAVGEVDDLLIDPDGRIVFMILANSAGKVAVPFALLSRKGENTFVLNADPAKLASAPRFNRYEDSRNPEYAINVYKHFGVHPYWTR
jgi:sporulation protein YlmC with PRC-barrel domain